MSENADSAAAFSLLLTHLQQQKEAGALTVWLSPEARSVMRTWHLAQHPNRHTPGRAKPPMASPERSTVNRAPFSDSAPASKPPISTPADIGQLFASPADSDRRAQLIALKDEMTHCPQYHALIQSNALRDTMVFSVGNPHSPLVFIGEAPGAEEEKLNEPFVGPAGNLLTKIIGAMGLQRSQVYITNIVKYRPSTGSSNQGNTNRAPTTEEIAVGLPWLQRELNIVSPQVIVALGGTAIEGLLGEAIPVGKARAQFHDFQGIVVMPTYHPSYLLRNESLTERRKVWEDLLQVMERLRMPISDKQRAYFKV